MQNNSFNHGVFNRAIVAILFVGYILYILPKFLAGGMLGVMVLLPVFGLLFFFLFKSSEKIWPALLFTIASGCWLPAPTQLLTRLLLTNYIVLGIALIMLVEKSFIRRARFGMMWYDQLMICIAIGVTAVILRDRPGALFFGSKTLGLARALRVLLGVWGYFIARRIVLEKIDWKLQVKWLIPLFIAVFLYGELYLLSTNRAESFLNTLYSSQSWGLFSALLAMICAAPVFKKRRYYACCIAMLVMGLGNIHRSRILFAAAGILGISLISRRLKYAVIVFMICGIAGLGLIGIFGQEIIPKPMLRAASLFLPVDTTAIKVAENEAGWKSDFRADMRRFAWMEIKEHPFAGTGFAQNVEEAKSLFWIQGFGSEAVAFMGGYHNYYMTFAVACGLILATLYCFVSFLLLWKFFLYCRREPRGIPSTVFSWAVFGYCCHLYGMVLANGIEPEFVTQCVCMGMMSGIMFRDRVGFSSKSESVPGLPETVRSGVGFKVRA